MSDKAVLTCALTGALTNPTQHNVPVTPEEMADAAEQAWNEGAVMGVASGQAAKREWLPLLKEEMLPGTHWQTIAVGRAEIWDLHRGALELGGDVRTGLEDTFYLPNGEKAKNNGELVKALADIARDVGRDIAGAEEAREILGIKN